MARDINLGDSADVIDPVMEQAFSFDASEELVEDVLEEDSHDDSDDLVQEEEPLLEEETEFIEDSQVVEEPVSLEPQKNMGPSISEIEFPDLAMEQTGSQVDLDSFSNIPINLSVELGRSQITLKEVYELAQGSIIELERLVGEPLDLVVNEQIIAQGEVVAIDNNYGLRITSIVSKPT